MATRRGRKVGTRPPRKVIQPIEGVDLGAVPCVDSRHHWHAVEIVRSQKGKLRGLPVRISECHQCKSTKEQYLTWDGRLAGATVYHLEDSYIENARLLDDDQHLRAVAYRREMLRQWRAVNEAELMEAASA